MTDNRLARLLVACGLAACSQDVATGQRCRSTDQPSCGSHIGTPAGASSAAAGEGAADGSSPQPLAGMTGADAPGQQGEVFSAHIEDSRMMRIELIALRCDGECADVEVVATGGNPPYTFRWQDGSTATQRHVCPNASTTLSVSATDSARDTPEFRYAARTVSTNVTLEVLACPDAGPAQTLCIGNPSFEGVVTPNQFSAFDAPPWNSCYTGGFITYSAIADPTLWPFQNWTFPKAADGATYLALGQQGPAVGRASQVLCEPIGAGTSRSFRVHLARATSNQSALEAQDQVMQVLGGSECGESELLWTSPQLGVDWTSYCVTVSPQHDVASLGFRPLGSAGGSMEGLVDHIVPVASCPDPLAP